MATKTALHRSHLQRLQSIRWDESSPLSMQIETREGNFRTRHGHFVGGAADRVEVIEVDNDAVRVMILASRGMSIWSMESGEVSFGWRSPILGPVHPSQVPVFDPSGIGWLEGFDEFVVRCGLESNGAPEHDEAGRLVYPLHGRVGNLPADSLSIEYNEASGRLEVIGEILESRMFIKRLRLRSRIRFQAGKVDVELLDDVTNELSQATTIQLLYHINVGPPVLGEGARLEAPLQSLAPKDDLSASEIERWNEYDAPQPGYAERVYFARLRSDEVNLTSAMLRSADGERGLGISFNTSGLSRFVVWKNTAAESDGYVTGLEPATNYPNTRSFEEKEGRVVEIPPGETAAFRVKLHPLCDAAAVEAMSKRIETLRGDDAPETHQRPRPGWSPGA